MKLRPIKRLNKLPLEIKTKMKEDLISYESAHGIDVNYKYFSLILENENEQVIGVINAYTAFAEIYVDDIWIDSKFRGLGYGKYLIESLEHEFEDKGFNNINLVTSAFQAPEFYKKCGYELEFVRKNDKNPKLTKFFFIKYFKNKVQKQGLAN